MNEDKQYIHKGFYEVAEILCGDSPNWTYEEVLERAKQAIDALRREENEVLKK